MANHVLHVISSSARRGAQTFAVTLSLSLDGAFQNEVVALSAPAGGEALDVRVLGSSWRSIGTLRELRRDMARSSVVVAHGSVTLQATVMGGTGLSVPIVYKNIGDPWYWANSRRRRWQTAALLRRVSAVAALTPGAAQAVHECWRVPSERIFVTGGGRDPRAIRPPTVRERVAARRELDLDESTPVVLYLGALSHEKRPELAIEAVGALPDVTLLVAGDGPLRDDLAAQAAEFDPRIRMLGSRSDVLRLLHASDVLVLTSESEGLPGVLIEAGLAGLPAVTTDAGFAKDVVQHGTTGMVVERPVAEDVAAALVAALADAGDLGAAARRHCEEHFDVERSRARWHELLLNVSSAEAP